ncbi:MAG: tetratricopeptide repeat protein [Pirellulales bacterium]|nr:tetratricopeptide repeat protein [Pirellulales bacterium]
MPNRPEPGRRAIWPRFRRWRKWLVRLLAVVLAPLLFLTLIEGGLRLLGYGDETSYFIRAKDPEVWLSNPKFGYRFFGPDLARTPTPTVMAGEKPPKTYRVFVFGGSAAHGTPDPAFSFGRLLEAMLTEQYPQTHFEVINTAMVAVNSHVVLPIARECRGFQADLYIVYLGNNEVVGPYGAGTVFESPSTSIRLTRASIYARATRLGQLMGHTIRAVAGEDSQAKKEWGGMAMFLDHRVAADDARMGTVYDNYHANLNDLCLEARRAGVPVLLTTVLTNLKDCPPFHSLHRPGLPKAEKARWEEAYAQGNALRRSGDHQQAIQQYETAEAIDDQYAELHFQLGQSRLALGQFELARHRLVRARDLDALRFRADTRINQIIRQVAADHRSHGAHLVDSEELAWAGRQSPHGIPGSELLHEHVHLNFAGNYLVAAALFERLVPLLSPEICEDAPRDPSPPSPARCRQLTLFTEFNQFYAVTKIAEITMDPPFPKTIGQRCLAEAKRLEAELTPDVLSRIAKQYERALDDRPKDLLLRQAFALVQSSRQQHASAAEQYAALIRQYPLCTQWHCQLGRALASQGKTADAIAEFRCVLQREPNHVLAHTSLASALADAGREDEAIAQYERALSVRPNDETTHWELGRMHLEQGRPQKAEQHFAAALKIHPESSRSLHFFLGRALAQQNKIKQAIEQYRQELSVHPRNPLPHVELAGILLAGSPPQQTRQALQHYERAVELDPDLLPALNNLAWIRATNPIDDLRNGHRAVLLAEHASGLLRGADPTILDTLAAAYAEAGLFHRAAETARKAIALAEQAEHASLAEQIRGRLDLYLAGKPYRD